MDTPDNRHSYRHLLANTLYSALSSDGTEAGEKTFLDAAVRLEKWLTETFNVEPGKRIPVHLELKALARWHRLDRPDTIDEILELAQARIRERIQKSLDEGEESKDLLILQMEEIFLPPGELEFLIGSGEHKYEDPKFQNRLNQLIETLPQHGIYTDDIVLIRGTVSPNMMRKVPYVIIEIPKLNREVLLCNQVGEATFVVYGIMNRISLARLKKKELQNDLGERVKKIEYREEEQWKNEVISALLRDVDMDSLRKINVRDLESLRSEIFRLVPDPEKWAGMKYNEKKKFKIGGRGLIAIATIFGVKGNPGGYHSVHLELGKKIYGDHPAFIYEEKEKIPDLSPEELKKEILKTVPSPEKWAKMKRKEKPKFKIAGRGLEAIARIFGVKGDPVGYHTFHMVLGKKIYGDHPAFIYEEIPDLSPEEIKEEILKTVPSPEKWLEMRPEERSKFKIAGRGLVAIARVFGVKGDPVSYHSVYLELGKKIYGDHPAFFYEEIPDLSLEELKEEILKTVPGPEMWAEMRVKEKLKFKIAGRGLVAIATIFGMKGNPISYHSIHLELGKKIYGDHPAFFYEEKEEIPDLSLEELKEEILKTVPSPEKWAVMKQTEKLKFKIAERGLRAIARVIGVYGNPNSYHSVHLELGKKIYGDHPAFFYEEIPDLSLEEIKEEILKTVPGPEMWAEMRVKEKLKFKIAGRGLVAIARVFGVKGHPISNHSVHLELGKRIYDTGEGY